MVMLYNIVSWGRKRRLMRRGSIIVMAFFVGVTLPFVFFLFMSWLRSQG